ncbi:MAG: T9SS type A sorting domain-containing protein [Bacteroidia bacterium]|nr:T9SS type A sorting domain-containing protein [Bacteroidia bacterium]
MIIKDAIFVNDYIGCLLNAVENPSVTKNIFIVESKNDAVGLYLYGCTGYQVEENYFSTELMSYDVTGVVVRNSGINPNEIYKNQLAYLPYSITSIGANRGATYDGLQFKCNSNANNHFDISALQYGTEISGIAPVQGSSYYPARNTFSHTCANTDNDLHNEASNFTYYHLDNTPETPQCYTINKVFPNMTNTTEETCPSKISSGLIKPGQLIGKINATKSSVNKLITQYEQKIDGGKTEELVEEIEISMPVEAVQIKNELLNISPYVSEDVMEKTVEKETTFNEMQVKEVLVANPHSAKSDRVWKKLDERINPLPESMLAEIRDGKEIISPKETLESKIATKKLEREWYLNEAIRYFIDDESPSSQIMLVNILEHENTFESACKLLSYYLSVRKPAEARELLNSLPVVYKLDKIQYEYYTKLVLLCTVQIELMEQNLPYFRMSEQQKQIIKQLAQDQTYRTGVIARNILNIIEGGEEDIVVLYPDENFIPKSFNIVAEEIFPGNTGNEIFEVYPNPANKYFTVEYQSTEEFENIRFEIVDVLGRTIKQSIVNGTNVKLNIETSDIEQGVYYCRLYNGDKKLDIKKFVISK